MLDESSFPTGKTTIQRQIAKFLYHSSNTVDDKLRGFIEGRMALGMHSRRINCLLDAPLFNERQESRYEIGNIFDAIAFQHELRGWYVPAFVLGILRC